MENSKWDVHVGQHVDQSWYHVDNRGYCIQTLRTITRCHFSPYFTTTSFLDILWNCSPIFEF